MQALPAVLCCHRWHGGPTRQKDSNLNDAALPWDHDPGAVLQLDRVGVRDGPPIHDQSALAGHVRLRERHLAGHE